MTKLPERLPLTYDFEDGVYGEDGGACDGVGDDTRVLAGVGAVHVVQIQHACKDAPGMKQGRRDLDNYFVKWTD